MQYQEAIEKVQQKLLEYSKPPEGWSAHVYDYSDGDQEKHARVRPHCGIRVSEVSFRTANAGSSYMQVDIPWGLAVCAQTERVLLALVENWEDEEIEEEFTRLEYCFSSQEKEI